MKSRFYNKAWTKPRSCPFRQLLSIKLVLKPHIFTMFLLVICLCTSCQEKTPLQKALSSSSPAIQRVMSNPNKYEVQIIFSEIQRDSSSQVQFIDDEYQVNDNDYFYPASTVKLPLAILALEKINEYNTRNIYFRAVFNTLKLNILPVCINDICYCIV